MKYYVKKKYPENELLQRVIWVLFNILASITPFHSPGGARPHYLNNCLNPIFAFSSFKNSIPALNRDTRAVMWGPAYLSNHRQAVKVGSILSDFYELIWTSQVPVLHSLLFSVYTTPLTQIPWGHLPFLCWLHSAICKYFTQNTAFLENVRNSLKQVSDWMAMGQLKFNPDRTEFPVMDFLAQCK